MTARLRDCVASAPRYRAGARPAPGTTALRLASNENPYPPLPGVLDAALDSLATANRYPDPAASALVADLAARHGVDPASVVVGTGSVALLQHLVPCVAGPGDEVVFAWRSFDAYPVATALAGARAVPVPLAAGERHDLGAMAAAVTPATRLVVVCTPNNPTGTVIGHRELREFVAQVPDDVLVVVDEAYAEFVRDPGAARALDLLAEHDNVCVLRTFSKAYGLAGMRVGYAVAAPGVADALRANCVPFGVTDVAQAAARASLAAEPALTARVDALVAERSRLAAGLRSLGYRPVEGEANFVWLRLGPAGESFARASAAAGVLVRPYPPDGVRITVGLPDENAAVLAAAASLKVVQLAECWTCPGCGDVGVSVSDVAAGGR